MILSVVALQNYTPPAGISVISFDVFDTLLIRTVDPPALMKELAAKKAVSSLSLAISPEDLHSRRLTIESDLCRRAAEEGRDKEYSVTEVYARLCESLPGLDATPEQLVTLELEVEKTHAVAMPGIDTVLARLAEHHRLVAISDTYLPGRFIRELLDDAHLGGYFSSVYASCDHGCNKGSGRLFSEVMANEGHPPHQWLHIGDNFLSDYFMPRSIGVASLLVQDSGNRKRKVRQSALSGLAKRSPVWKGFEVMASVGIDVPAPATTAEARLHEWGMKTVGPAVVLFVHELCNRLRQSPSCGVYFLAREGYMLKRLYETFNRELYGGVLPEGRYLCISRSTAFLASLGDIGEREIDLVLQDHSVLLSDVLRRFGVTDDREIDWIAREYGVDPSLADKGKIRTLLAALAADERFTSLVADASESMQQKLGSYIESQQFFAYDEVVLVDVGWHGTIQDYLERYLSRRGSSPRVQGYYLGVDYNRSCRFSNKTGLLYDFRVPTVDGVCLTFFRLAFEFSLRGGHGTTVGYECDANGSYRPVFRTTALETEAYRQIRVIQQGVTACAASYLRRARGELFAPSDLRPAVLHLHNRRISFPDQETIAAFSSIIHTDDYATGRFRQITGSLDLAGLMAPSKSFSRFIEIPWRETALVGLRIPFLLGSYYLFKRVLAAKRIRECQKTAGREWQGGAGLPPQFSSCFMAAYYVSLLMGGSVALGTKILVRALDLLTPQRAVLWVQRLITLKSAVFTGSGIGYR